MTTAKTTIAIAASAILALVAACGWPTDDAPTGPNPVVQVTEIDNNHPNLFMDRIGPVDLSDGTQAECFWVHAHRIGGLSCFRLQPTTEPIGGTP